MSSKKLPYCSATVHSARKGCEELTDVNANFSLQKAWNEKKRKKYERNRSKTDAKHNNSQLCCLFSLFFAKSVFFFAFWFGSAFAGHLLILLCVSPSGWHNTCTVYVCMHVQAARFISTHLNSSYFC